MRRRCWLVVLGTFCVPLAPLLAQNHSAVSGLVRDSSGAPVRGALVTIASLQLETRTDTLGAFTFTGVPLGPTKFLVRRMGFAPQTVERLVSGDRADSLRFTLTAQPLPLDPVVVSERDMRRKLYINEFHQRRQRGQGFYITRKEIEDRHTTRLSDVMRNVPGVRLVRTRGGYGLRFMSSMTMRRDCAPMIWLDGQRAPGMELDELVASDIEGIELYNGPSTTPMRFSQNHETTCGTIVIWTRLPGG